MCDGESDEKQHTKSANTHQSDLLLESPQRLLACSLVQQKVLFSDSSILSFCAFSICNSGMAKGTREITFLWLQHKRDEHDDALCKSSTLLKTHPSTNHHHITIIKHHNGDI